MAETEEEPDEASMSMTLGAIRREGRRIVSRRSSRRMCCGSFPIRRYADRDADACPVQNTGGEGRLARDAGLGQSDQDRQQGGN